MKTANDFYMDIVMEHNKLLNIIKDFEAKQRELNELTGMNVNELIEAIKSGKVVV